MFLNVSISFFLIFGITLSAQTTKSVLDWYNFSAKNIRQIELPKKLKEISGLAVSSNGRLFGHNDESGDIFQINTDDGSIVKQFSLGPRRVLEDFEGIAAVRDTFYLVTSSGDIFQCAEGTDNGNVSYKVYESFLSEEYDVEGLCFDPQTNCLLLACKGYSGLAYIGAKVVYAFSLETKKLGKTPRFVLSLKEIEQWLNDKPFYPSGMEYISHTETFVVLDSKIKSVVEISSTGKILSARKIKSSRHAQPEGITFLPDGSLVISDEGAKNGTLTIYTRTQ